MRKKQTIHIYFGDQSCIYSSFEAAFCNVVELISSFLASHGKQTIHIYFADGSCIYTEKSVGTAAVALLDRNIAIVKPFFTKTKKVDAKYVKNVYQVCTFFILFQNNYVQ